MARFYGTVRGGRGEATRLGHASTGLRVTAQSWQGRVHVHLTAQDDGNDAFQIEIVDRAGHRLRCENGTFTALEKGDENNAA